MKQKTQVTVLIVLVAIAVGIFGWQYLPSGANKSASASVFQNYQRLDFPNPEIHWPTLASRRKAEYKPSGANLFSTTVLPTSEEIQKQKDAEQKRIEDVARQPVVAPPPELPMKFFGYGTVPNGTPRRAFLVEGDEVYIVSEGDTLMGRFRIIKINNASLEFEEVASGRRGQKALEDPGPAT